MNISWKPSVEVTGGGVLAYTMEYGLLDTEHRTLPFVRENMPVIGAFLMKDTHRGTQLRTWYPRQCTIWEIHLSVMKPYLNKNIPISGWQILPPRFWWFLRQIHFHFYQPYTYLHGSAPPPTTYHYILMTWLMFWGHDRACSICHVVCLSISYDCVVWLFHHLVWHFFVRSYDMVCGTTFSKNWRW